jgi:hypothetical protein
MISVDFLTSGSLAAIGGVEVSSETKNQMNTSELKQRRLLKDG